MKPNRRTIGIITGIIIAVVAAGIGFVRGYFIHDVCTGMGYSFTRTCADSFINHVGLFAVGSLALLITLLGLAAWSRVKPSIRVVALGVFLIYALWTVLFSSSVWDTPYFTAYVYDPSHYDNFDWHCSTCQLTTATRVP
jgi:hypothetical protein